MHRTRRHWAVVLVMSVFVAGAGYALADVAGCGDVLASFRGVSAFSNGPDQTTENSCVDERGPYGWQYQCVELVKRFYAVVLRVDTKTSGWAGNASDYFDTAAGKGLMRFQNGQTTARPEPEDILVFTGGPEGYGHLAIVAAATSTSVSVIEQNASASGTKELSLTVQDGKWLMPPRHSLTVAGWLRKAVDFAMLFLSVDGNILGRGNPDNAADFFDAFSDGLLTSGPTASFTMFQPMAESGGALLFRTADGSRTVTRFGRTFIEDDVTLNIPLTRGAGNSESLAAFRADTPAMGQFYGIGTVNSGTSLQESVALAVVRRRTDGQAFVQVNDHTGAVIAADPTTLPPGGFIFFRLFVNDSARQVIASYSLDNGATFKAANQFAFFLRHGTIFNATSSAFIFAQGGMGVSTPPTSGFDEVPPS